MSVEELYHFELSPNGEEIRFMGGCILTAMGISTATLCTAVESVVKNSENVKPWLLTLAAIRCSDYYYEEYQKYTEDPCSTDVFDKLFKEHPEIPATLKVSCDAKLLSIERGTRFFPGCDLSFNVVNNQEIKMSLIPAFPNPEAVQNAFEKLYKQPTGKDYHKGSTNVVIPKYLKKRKFFVKAHRHRPATMNLGELLRQVALLVIAESKDVKVPRPGTRTSFDNVRGKLVADEWSIVDIVRLLDPALLRLVVEEYRRIYVHTIPDRNFNCPIIVDIVNERYQVKGEPVNPTGLDYLLAEAAEGENIRLGRNVVAMNAVPQSAPPQQEEPQEEPQPTAPHHGTQPSDTGIDRAENANATPHHDARQPDVAALAAGAVDTINQRPPSAINDIEGDFDDMVDQFAEDFEPHLLEIATNLEQNPEGAPNPAASQGTINTRPNQANVQANLQADAYANSSQVEADMADESIVETSYRRVARCRKRSADEAQVHQYSSSHRQARQTTAYESAEVHRRLETTSGRIFEAQQARSDTGGELPEAGLQGVARNEGRNNANAGSTIERFLSVQEQMLEIYRIELINNINGAGRNGDVIHNP